MFVCNEESLRVSTCGTASIVLSADSNDDEGRLQRRIRLLGDGRRQVCDLGVAHIADRLPTMFVGLSRGGVVRKSLNLENGDNGKKGDECSKFETEHGGADGNEGERATVRRNRCCVFLLWGLSS